MYYYSTPLSTPFSVCRVLSISPKGKTVNNFDSSLRCVLHCWCVSIVVVVRETGDYQYSRFEPGRGGGLCVRRGNYEITRSQKQAEINLFFLRTSMEQTAQRVHSTDSRRARQTRVYKFNQAEGPSQCVPYPNNFRRSAEPTYQRHPALEAALVGRLVCEVLVSKWPRRLRRRYTTTRWVAPRTYTIVVSLVILR